MSKDRAIAYRDRAVKLFNVHKDEIPVGEKALLGDPRLAE
jgi:hypothetical protein